MTVAGGDDAPTARARGDALRRDAIRRRAIGGASILLLAALAWPAVAPGELDSLPLSNYPMFAHERDRVSSFHVVVRVDSEGTEHALDLRVVGGTDQPVQAAMTVSQAIRAGEADELCAEIADRIAGPITADGTIEVLTVRYDAPGWFDGEREPVERIVHAACAAPGEEADG